MFEVSRDDLFNSDNEYYRMAEIDAKKVASPISHRVIS